MKRLMVGLAAFGFAAMCGCMSDKSANGDTPFEAARYPAMQSYLDSAFTQFCASFDDALAARFQTDTAAVPGIDWPFKMPPRRRDGITNFVDSNTSWGVGYNRLIDTTRYAAFWDLGRLVDTGVLGYTSPLVANHIEHMIEYGRTDGSGESEKSWDGTLNVSLTGLDTDVAHAMASFVAGHRIKGQCGDLACDHVDIAITDGEFGKVAGQLSTSTLSGTISGTAKLTEFDVILGHEAVFTWQLTGTVSQGVATVTVSSGKFTATDTYPLCP